MPMPACRVRPVLIAVLAAMMSASITTVLVTDVAQAASSQNARAVTAAAKRVTAARQALTAKKRILQRCQRVHSTATHRCASQRRAVLAASRRLNAAQIALSELKRRPSARTASISQTAPTLRVSGQKLYWNQIASVTRYVFVRKVPGTPDEYSVVTGTSTTPPPAPGKTVHFSVRTDIYGSRWAPEVSITYPATTPAPAPAPAPTTSTGLVVGLVANTAGWGGTSTAGRLDTVTSQTGAKWLREDIWWSTVEPSNGTFDFSYYDHYMLLAAQRGLHILPVLGGAPSWAAPSGTLPSDPSTYAAYVAAVVKRYGPNGTFWAQNPTLKGSAIQTFELWNEPYYMSNYNPAAYARLVKAATIAGRQADPNAKFLMAAEMQSRQDANGNWVWWVDALYQAVPDLNNYFDGVAVHPYGTDTTGLIPMVYGVPYNNYDRLRRIEDIRSLFLNHSADKPFWLTEIGWSTCSTGDAKCVTETQQAADLTNLLTYVNGSVKSWVHAAFIYRYEDLTDNSAYENGFGLVHTDLTPKPALSIFKSAAASSA
jgi:Glycosyl hydrolases family 39